MEANGTCEDLSRRLEECESLYTQRLEESTASCEQLSAQLEEAHAACGEVSANLRESALEAHNLCGHLSGQLQAADETIEHLSSRSRYPTPCTLNATPYTLHLTPYTLQAGK